MTDDRHRYFAYGSNLHRPQMAALAPSAVVVAPARLVGWELFVTAHGVLSIRPTGPDSEVLGLVWACTGGDLEALDRFEAVDEGLYQRIVVDLEGDGPAVAYRALSPAEGPPRPGYLEASVLPPMRELGFPPPYVARVERWLAAGTAGPAWVATPAPGGVFTASESGRDPALARGRRPGRPRPGG